MLAFAGHLRQCIRDDFSGEIHAFIGVNRWTATLGVSTAGVFPVDWETGWFDPAAV